VFHLEWNIAKKRLGNPTLYRNLIKNNHGEVSDSNKLTTLMALKVNQKRFGSIWAELHVSFRPRVWPSASSEGRAPFAESGPVSALSALPDDRSLFSISRF